MTAPEPSSGPAPDYSIEPPDAEALADARIRGLVERYARLVGAHAVALEPHLLELELPPSESRYFRGRRVVRIAFSLGALERCADAEMAVVGSALLDELIAAVRARGQRQVLGLLQPTVNPEATATALRVPLRNGTISPPSLRLALHPLGRLVARVTLSAGASVEERIVESSVFDLSVGAAVDSEIAALCEDLELGRVLPATDAMAEGSLAVPGRPAAEVVQLMLDDLEAKLAEAIERRRTFAERALATELGRIDQYYASLLEGPAGPGTQVQDSAGRRVIEAEHQRRRGEEERRHQVRAALHPLQLVECRLLVQRGEWTATSAAGRHGVLLAARPLSGLGGWSVVCPSCGRPPSEVLVCRHGHVACSACATTCSVCSEECCRTHGIAACHLDGAPVCDEHVRKCRVCSKDYCTVHGAICAEGEHAACAGCVAPCAHCRRSVCTQHATISVADAPKGCRRLCRECVVACEGGTSELVGVDEVIKCASCSRFVCANHQATCTVDGKVHCSRHLRRSDRSRRLLCESHRARCSHEPEAIFATDEVSECATCGTSVCRAHGDTCSGDRMVHCKTHLQPLLDTRDEFGCPKHRSQCHVDGRTYSFAGTTACPVCGRLTCREHLRACKHCGRLVCQPDRRGTDGQCVTCGSLTALDEPPDAVLAAALVANGGDPPRAKGWSSARDASHVVVQMDLGWTRKLVMSVRHGDMRPDTVVRHSLLGSSKQA